MKKLLILSPYDGQSHRFWRQGLASFLAGQGVGFKITEATLPARYFSWRQRGNSLSFAMAPALQQHFDLLVVTSMTDLSALRGMNRHLARVPTIAYFHENQFAYPGDNTLGLLERQLTSVYTAISADWLFFNSEYNRATFLAGAEALLSGMPDEVPRGIVGKLREKSTLVPVALDRDPVAEFRTPGEPVRILWNHRWEHDKGPLLLKAIVDELIRQALPFRMSLLGQQFRRQPLEFEDIVATLRTHGSLLSTGYIDGRQAYLDSIKSHDFVLSTASQEFQGLAVQEAMALGCIPIVPDALCYPEYVPVECRYRDPHHAVQLILTHRKRGGGGVVALADYTWGTIGPAWLQRLQVLQSGNNNEPDCFQSNLGSVDGDPQG